MAVTVISYPQGHKLANTLYSAEIVDSAGDALVVHSTTVTDGAHVYIESNIERYAGFKFVIEVSPTSFKIRDDIGGDEISFVQESDITFQISILEHTWQSVHLPIVYKLTSTLFPNNSVDPERTVLSFADLNGYTYLTVSDSIGSVTSFEALDFVKIVGAASSEVNGVFQIIFRNAGDIFSIDLAYDSTYDFTGATVQLYKSNYFVTVEVYSGLESGHRWDDQKPSQLAATLRLIPDGNNLIQFSISEILKGQINTRNNLQLDTLPNNLDFYTQFHIAWYESYDLADDGEIVVFDGSTTVDSFIGNAVNSMTPFKSLNESFMSDYIDAGDGLLLPRWLTLSDRPVAVVGHYFDLSFLLSRATAITVTIFKRVGAIVTSTEIIEIPNPGIGVIRVPINIESGYDMYCVQAQGPGSSEDLDLLLFGNTGSGSDWDLDATPASVGTSSSKILYKDFTFAVGTSYDLLLTFNYFTSGATTGNITFAVYTSSNVIVYSEVDPTPIGDGTYSMPLTFLADASITRIGVQISAGKSGLIQVTDVSVSTSAINITEQICIDIISECGDTFTNDNLRITETELFRELE